MFGGNISKSLIDKYADAGSYNTITRTVGDVRFVDKNGNTVAEDKAAYKETVKGLATELVKRPNGENLLRVRRTVEYVDLSTGAAATGLNTSKFPLTPAQTFMLYPDNVEAFDWDEFKTGTITTFTARSVPQHSAYRMNTHAILAELKVNGNASFIDFGVAKDNIVEEYSGIRKTHLTWMIIGVVLGPLTAAGAVTIALLNNKKQEREEAYADMADTETTA